MLRMKWDLLLTYYTAAHRCVYFDSDACIFCSQELGETALAAAVRLGQLEATQRLIERGGDRTCRDRAGRTLLMKAAQEGHNNLVDYLVHYLDAKGELNLNDVDHVKVWPRYPHF